MYGAIATSATPRIDPPTVDDMVTGGDIPNNRAVASTTPDEDLDRPVETAQ
jgi:hypothetical protein